MKSVDSSIIFSSNLQAVLVLVAVFFLGSFFLNRKKKVNLPPGPPCLPVVGSLPWLGMDIREPLRKMGKKYGDIFTVYLGSRPAIMFNSYDVMKEAFVKNGHVFSGRPQDMFFISELTQGRGIGSTQGDLWKEQRRFGQIVLRDMGMGKSVLEEKIIEELSFFIDHFKGHAGKPFDPGYIVRMAVGNIIGSVLWGKRSDYEDPRFVEYIRIITDVVEEIGSGGALTAFPFLRYLPGDPFHCTKLLNYHKHFMKEFKEKIEEHRQTHVQGEHKDFIDAFITKMEKEKDNENTTFTEKQLQQVVLDMLTAGVETTGSTTIWCIVYMLHYPDVLKKVQKEILKVLGKDKVPSMKDKLEMPFTEAVIMEVQRMADVIPFAVPHTVLEDTEFRGYRLPKATTIIPNLYAAHRDERVWGDPDKFRPSRFLDENGKISKKEQLISFGIGRRICLGESLARMAVFLIFTNIFQKFKLELAPGEKLPPLVSHLGFGHAPEPFKILAKPKYA